MSEYYTPEIEEFHVGFEYQSLYRNVDSQWWINKTWRTNDSVHNFFNLQIPRSHSIPSSVRVKHLDREDIESLGFTDYKHSAYDWYKFSKAIECPIANYNYCGARLLYDRSTSGIIIMGYEYQFELDEDKNAVNLFRGIIKNKSELVKLLKQLGC